MTSLPGNSAGDGRGHGTLVAGLAAGSARDHAGAAPTAGIVSLDVMDDQGMARTSDVIAAAQWILKNRTQYDIRVANFSLHSASPTSFRWDPLDKAVEKLWFARVVVVAAAGNQAKVGQSTPMAYAPGERPVRDHRRRARPAHSTNPERADVAPWSAWGYTLDGFAKPELAAPRPRDRRAGAGELDARGRATQAGDPHDGRHLHGALGHVALRSDRGRDRR